MTELERRNDFRARVAKLEAAIIKSDETLFDFDKKVARIAELEALAEQRYAEGYDMAARLKEGRIAELEAALAEAEAKIFSRDVTIKSQDEASDRHKAEGWRKGAEAMRKACAKIAYDLGDSDKNDEVLHNDIVSFCAGYETGCSEVASAIRALDIPEETP